MTNLERFIKQLGWQGGTIHQVAEELQIDVSDILNAEFVEFTDFGTAIKGPKLLSPDRVHVVGALYNKDYNKNYLEDGYKWVL